MVHEAANGIRSEVREKRDGNRAVSVGCEEGDGPAGGVGCTDSDLLPLDYAGVLEKNMQPLYLIRDFSEGKCVAPPVTKGFLVPVLPGRLGEKFQIVDHNSLLFSPY